MEYIKCSECQVWILAANYACPHCGKEVRLSEHTDNIDW